ncbi:alanine racemase domain protein [Rhodomicrobium vannielii ATCC 17100]|uniref:Pyridoxal phosphate homeostasis protein n=1 Tax=Rhodomicrobium vannielii (strain ATCC 17100 / DSM 162 / LMG 4299 / NCIMB 10020 / ATH 3.1.1) TaxID=648757 RepID=E3HZ22_RHOVT|nr:YggS family pyridoxal phosphate-dependent enzyme [Rhodomicrobium vannielii]ADP72069.1 alanine racemase domain protein [Rhodomicrobium vannielii ATCC 17100]
MSTDDQPFNSSAVEDAYLSIRERVWRAAQNAGRDPASVKLVAVTKTFDAEHIRPVLRQGHVLFGENRIQEAMRKWPPLREEFPRAELHVIGPIQTNKAREAVAFFDCIETVDRPKLAAALAQEIQKQGRAPKLFVQVNIGEEPQKAGIAPDEAAAFVRQCEREYGLSIAGLMCIPPFDDDPVPFFEKMAALRKELGLLDLSMGMSGDFEAAIAAGATLVRVGSAIFGVR